MYSYCFIDKICSLLVKDTDLEFIYDDQFFDIEYWSHAEKTAFLDNIKKLSKLLKT